MPKLKTHKGAQARVRFSGSGKLLRMKGHSSHLRRKKPKRTRRMYDDTLPVSRADRAKVRRLLPYG
ncbi:MAG: 50S ribosomal protein L35 [Chloroflexi bacterium]|nr:50S ribosomal protein L35 [Chloroflexota bacterium]